MRKTGNRWVAVLAVACVGAGGWGLVGCGDSGAGHDGDAGVSDGGGDAGAVIGWDEPDLPYRVTVTLNAHPDRDREDVPVATELAHPGRFIRRGVRVYEISGDGSRQALSGAAWSQPDGTVLEVGFTAGGTTPAGATRRFLVYYEVADQPDSWSGVAGDWGGFEVLDRDGNGVTDAVALTNDRYTLQREIRESDGTLVRGRDDLGDSFLRLEPDWDVVEGFSNQYALESPSATYDARNVEDGPPTLLVSDEDGFGAAGSMVWQGRTDPVEHDLYLTYRVFRDWPMVEMVLSATCPGEDAMSFTSASWHGRTLYLPNEFDRMVSDDRGDEPLAKVWDTAMRWLVVYDSGSGRGMGWFDFHPGVIRADPDSGLSLYDSYGYAAANKTRWRYLWMASTDKDEIVERFDAMAPGVTVSGPENRDLNIVAPAEGTFLFPEDTLQVEVTTPGSQAPVTAEVLLADQTRSPVLLERTADPSRWRSVTPLALTGTHPPGRWTVSASSGAMQAEVHVEFRLPHHPKLVFGPEDLAALRARKDDPAYAGIWAEMLRQAEGYGDPIPDPGEGKDIRSYADRLMNLALIQLVDPSQPYDAKLWSYFFAMLRYPNWDEGAAPFNNLDLTVGHFLTALAITYDWHYDHLTSAERQETRARLHDVTRRWITSSHLRIYRDIDWHHFGTVTNNHYWINHEGVAAATFVLADEMEETERQGWVDHLEENLGIILSVLEPDGASNEGVPYHSYGQINLFRWLDMRDRALGGNTAESIPWFAESVLWDLYSILPGGDDNYGGVANFGDSPTRHYNPPRTIQAWLARRLGAPYAQWMAESLDWPALNAWSYLWYDPTVAAGDPHDLPGWRLSPDKGIFAWRSSWEPGATYFSLKSGSYFGGHEQPDAGHFILHRAGVPYVTDHGYSYWKMADEHNLVLVGDEGQYGDDGQWMSAVDPAHWARVDSVLADDSFFDLVADPAPMVRAEALSGWAREAVGLGPDLVVVRDTLDATADVSFAWLLHSYRSDPPTSDRSTYTYKDRRTENPFTEVSATQWTLLPQDTAPPLGVFDVSASSWTAQVEPSFYVPEQDPDGGGYNESLDSFQVGYRLRRTLTGRHVTSLVVLAFGATLTAEPWSTAQAEATRVTDGGSDVAVLIWPLGASVSGLHGFSVTGVMGGRRYDPPAVLARQATLLQEGSDLLLSASAPVDIYARLEHAAGPGDPTYALIRGAGPTDVSLRCPVQPTQVLLDGASLTFTWSAGILQVSVPPGLHRLETQ